MTVTYGSQAEAEMAIEALLDKHQRWLMQQPELLLIWSQPRPTRKRVADLLAKELTTIPVRLIDENTLPNRAMRREILATIRRADPEFWKGVVQAHDLLRPEERPAAGAAAVE